MGHVFISYSRRDKEKVDLIVQTLNASGFDVWIDRSDNKVGKSWRAEIVHAIDACKVFLLLLSRHSITLDNVRRELDLALDSNRIIFPVLLESLKLPSELKYQLTGLELINLHQVGFEEGLKQLVNTLKEEFVNRGG